MIQINLDGLDLEKVRSLPVLDLLCFLNIIVAPFVHFILIISNRKFPGLTISVNLNKSHDCNCIASSVFHPIAQVINMFFFTSDKYVKN